MACREGRDLPRIPILGDFSALTPLRKLRLYTLVTCPAPDADDRDAT